MFSQLLWKLTLVLYTVMSCQVHFVLGCILHLSHSRLSYFHKFQVIIHITEKLQWKVSDSCRSSSSAQTARLSFQLYKSMEKIGAKQWYHWPVRLGEALLIQSGCWNSVLILVINSYRNQTSFCQNADGHKHGNFTTGNNIGPPWITNPQKWLTFRGDLQLNLSS